MSWLETAIIIFGLLGFAAMGAVLALRIYRNPFLLTGLIPVVWAHVKPAFLKHVWPLLLKAFGRMDPADEARWRDCERRGGKWDHMRKKCDR